jgi:uncharacterized membrane protein
MEEKIVYSDILKAVWRGMKSQFWLLAGLLIGFTIVYSLLLIFILPEKGETVDIAGMIVACMTLLLVCLFLMGYLKNCLQTLDGEEPQFSAYGQVSRKLLRFLIAYLLFGIMLSIGLALLVIPGVYLGLRLQFFYASMVDEDTGVIESFRRSWEITKGCTIKLFVLMLIMTLIYFAGFAVLFIGIFVAIPFTTLMYAYTYRKLTAPNI